MKDRYEKDKAYVFMYTHFGRVDLVLTWSEIRLGGMDLALSILFNKNRSRLRETLSGPFVPGSLGLALNFFFFF